MRFREGREHQSIPGLDRMHDKLVRQLFQPFSELRSPSNIFQLLQHEVTGGWVRIHPHGPCLQSHPGFSGAVTPG